MSIALNQICLIDVISLIGREKINFLILSFDFGCNQFLSNSYRGTNTKFLFAFFRVG